MSSTRTYTPLCAVGEATGVGVRINDWDAYEAHMSEYAGRSITPLTFDHQEVNDDSYPRTYTEFTYLKGFAGYPDQHTVVDETTILKLENLGFDYDRTRFVEFWERVAAYCEPFEFYHSPANHFPSIADLLHGTSLNYAYHVKGADGTVEVSEVEFTQSCSPVPREEGE